MDFYPLDNPVDRELELVRPTATRIDEMLQSCHHPESLGDPGAAWTRRKLVDFVAQFPNGIDQGDPFTGHWPAYLFWMRLRSEANPVIPIAGTLSLRVVDTPEIQLYWGHIGYGVFPPARGHHYAERATRLILPLARKHGLKDLWITCNPDNTPSRRTCERLGAEMVEIVQVPRTNPLYAKGDREKCRYRLAL